MRINQFLARSGVGARRKVEEIVLAGRVKVNGKTLTDLSYRVDLEKDQVLVDGKTVCIDEEDGLPKIIAFNKPVGFLSSHEDKFHEKTIFDLLPKEFHKYNYAGRLDLDSRGLLILSSDGDFIQRVTHPSNKIEKEYIVTLQKKVDWKRIAEELRLGVREGGETLRAFQVTAAGLDMDKDPDNTNHLRVILKEGKKRQIRRMFHAKDLSVIDLFRVRVGGLSLEKKKLEEGKYISVTEKEILGK
ncbi:pseudouridine synthase [Leptospira ilyithenensis]|uniref:Pseudouridine synthase n=1 Tax=Leptospira ilyithenensis TaxID=2484901 RepID=A0A4R9LTI7_9LEPT|nr:pseudouridine synthase [Leptospira ilyithenensis]TGN13425.1 rRNA pseudouridine synthase [Leptospira ilyithenensis]